MKPVRLFGMILAGTLLTSGVVCAQGFPNKPIRLVVPFAPGGSTDIIARAIAEPLTKVLGQSVIVENKAGGGGSIGALEVVRGSKDGHVIGMATVSTTASNPAINKKIGYDPIKDFTPIVRVGELPFALAINPKIPAKTLQEFIDYAKKTPGKLAYATPNSTSLVAMETIKNIAGLDIVGVPYKASPQAMTDLISGEVQVYVVDLGSGMSSLKSDRVRLLAVTTAKGSQSFPGTPAIASVVKGFDLVSWNGIFGPANLPRPIVDKINAEMQAVFADKEFQAKIAATGFELDPTKTPEEFAKYVDYQLKHWGDMLRNAGVKPQ